MTTRLATAENAAGVSSTPSWPRRFLSLGYLHLHLYGTAVAVLGPEPVLIL